jgi:NAD(P)-dependent dehydrogenase (short-subunit alcohol dehydrogenase family)
MGRLANKIAFITGSSSGIGKACALRFAEEGAIVVGYDLQETAEGDWDDEASFVSGSDRILRINDCFFIR